LRPESTGPHLTAPRSSADSTGRKPATRRRQALHGLGTPAAGNTSRTNHGHPALPASGRGRRLGMHGASRDSDSCPDREWTLSPKKDSCTSGAAGRRPAGEDQPNRISRYQAPEATCAREHIRGPRTQTDAGPKETRWPATRGHGTRQDRAVPDRHGSPGPAVALEHRHSDCTGSTVPSGDSDTSPRAHSARFRQAPTGRVTLTGDTAPPDKGTVIDPTKHSRGQSPEARPKCTGTEPSPASRTKK
jgi:hypothetical protein